MRPLTQNVKLQHKTKKDQKIQIPLGTLFQQDEKCVTVVQKHTV